MAAPGKRDGERRRERAEGRAVTMETVGRIAGVSQVTVSRALRDPAKVSAETLARIRDAVEATGFVPNALAGALASRRSTFVTALVPSITNIVYAAMIQAFTAEMREPGYQILLSETGFDPAAEEALIATHLSRRPDAMLLTGIHHSARARRMLLGAAIPVVEVWDITDTPIDVCVGFNHAAAGRAVAEFARASRYGRAATVAAGDERARRRRDAFARAFAPPGEVEDVSFAAAASLARGREALGVLADRGFRGVVVASSDLLAHGIVTEAHARGLSVPGDIAVIGFGDQDFAAHTVPALTTVRVDRALLGRTAAKGVLARLAGEPVPPVADLGFTIVRRASA